MITTENQLDEWVRGNSRNAQGLVVELVWRLVAASSPKPTYRRFPLGDSIGQPGPDGDLAVAVGFEPFVPDGHSLWEIGTGLDPADKATSDYRDLTAATPVEVRRETTFIFVTPLSGRRTWGNTWKQDAQADWLAKRRRLGEWKDVRVIDGTQLIDWIRQRPSIDLWFAEETSGLPASQLETPEQRWAIARSFGEPPPLTPKIFLANRDEACIKLKEVFDETTSQVKLEARFPDQVFDFVCAFLASLDTEARAEASGRCLLVSSIEAWMVAVSCKEKHFLVADARLDLGGEGGTTLIQRARRAGHAVIFSGAGGGIPDPTSVPLTSPRAEQVKEALESAGYNEERARTLAQKSGGNLSSLLRCLQNLSVMPEWAETSVAAELAIAAMLGSWTDASGADVTAVETVSGKSYGEWIETMREIALRPGTPLAHRDGNWKFVSRYEGWYALGPRIFDEHLDRLGVIAMSVLQEDDPKFDLAPGERYAASIHGKVLTHSVALRRGIAECLALLGSHPGALTSCAPHKAENTAVLVVRGLLARADWRRWASLNDLLPLLAESAPNEFLEAVELSLDSNPCPFDQLFAQEGDGFTGGNYTSGLLWALETLAWDATLLTRVLICLGELAKRDPGGRWANRPANSLTTILLPWLPQTCATLAKRYSAVATLLKELPEVGWKLLLTLLPSAHSTSMGSRRPEWREIIPETWPKGATQSDYRDQVTRYSEMAISAATGDRIRLSQLIDHLENLPMSAQVELLGVLSSSAVAEMPEADRVSIWMELTDLTTKHRKYSDAAWAMKPEQVDALIALTDQLAPKASFYRHQRLFSERDFDLYEEKGDYEQQRAKLQTHREQAIEEIAATQGFQGVLTFVNSVQSPWRVGIAYGAIAAAEGDALVVPALLDATDNRLSQFVAGFLWSRYHAGGWQWADQIQTEQWTTSQIALFLSLLPFTVGTWERVTRLLGTQESAYWSRTNANAHDAEEGLDFAAEQLIKYERPYSAVRVLHKMLHDKVELNPDLIVRALLATVNSTESTHSRDSYTIAELIKYLQDSPSANVESLIRVEWAYLPLLDRHHDAAPKVLEQRLAKDPRFFCEVIRLVFKSKKRVEAEESSEDRKRIAGNGYRLLDGWQTPPGYAEDGLYDRDVLFKWVDAVKMECIDTGHLEIAMTMLGHVLIHAPADPSGLWIHQAAAEALNAKDAGDMRDGFRNALFNSRGVHWVDPKGGPERALAAKYSTQADEVEHLGYQRVAATVRQLAESYTRQAGAISSRLFADDY